MATITRFEDLEAWKVSRDLTKDIYRISKNNLFHRDFGLRDRICRASVSIMSNIAGDFERDGNKEFVNFLSIAKGSAGEVRSQLYVALDQNYISESEFTEIYRKADKNGKIIAGLMNYLNQTDVRGLKYK